MSLLARFKDSDTGESTLDVVNNYDDQLSLQMGYAEGVVIDKDMLEAEYISLILSVADEDILLGILSDRRLKRLATRTNILRRN